jgi:hypothetical protein
VIAVLLVLTLGSADASLAHRRVMTDDGVALGLVRYAPPGHDERPPVLIVTELGFGRGLADPLARALVADGRLVYVAQVRGQGVADAGASLRSIVTFDFPAIARAIGVEVDLVAHGWLGTLALAAAGHELPVRRVVALGTPSHFEVPSVMAEQLLSQGSFVALGLSPSGSEAFDALFVTGSPIGEAALSQVKAGLRDVPAPMAQEWLAWMKAGDLPLDGQGTVRSRLRSYDRDTLMLLGLGDGFAGPELCAPLRDDSRAKVRLHTFSRFDTGDDFSHVTALVGVNAPRLIFPELVGFLR